MVKSVLLVLPLLVLLARGDEKPAVNILVVGARGVGKSRVVNAGLRNSGLQTNPAVVGTKVMQRAVTTRLSRYCAPSPPDSRCSTYCWFDTPGLDVCPCLTLPGGCEALDTFDALVKGVNPTATWPPDDQTGNPLYSANVVLFVAPSATAVATACSRRLQRHIHNATGLMVSVVMVVPGTSTSLQGGDVPVVAVDIFSAISQGTASPLVPYIEPHCTITRLADESVAVEEEAEEVHIDDKGIADLAAAEAALKARQQAWLQEKAELLESARKADSWAKRIAERALSVGVVSVAVAGAVRLATASAGSAVAVLCTLFAWCRRAGWRIWRYLVAEGKRAARRAARRAGSGRRRAVIMGRDLWNSLRSGGAASQSRLRTALRLMLLAVGVIARGVLQTVLWLCGTVLTMVAFLGRLFPSAMRRFRDWRRRMLVAAAEKELRRRGVEDATVCGSCMSPLRVRRSSAAAQTSQRGSPPESVRAPDSVHKEAEPSPSPFLEGLELSLKSSLSGTRNTPSESKNIIAPPFQYLYRQPMQDNDGAAAEGEDSDTPPAPPTERKPSSWFGFGRPSTGEVVYVKWDDGKLYKAEVVKLLPNGAQVQWEERTEGSYSIIPYDRLIRDPWWKRSKLIHYLIGVAGASVQMFSPRRTRPRSKSLGDWPTPPHLTKPDSPRLRERRNTAPSSGKAELVRLPDFPREHRERRDGGRRGEGCFMDAVGAPVGTSFEDVCSAADSLQTTLYKKLVEQEEADGDIPPIRAPPPVPPQSMRYYYHHDQDRGGLHPSPSPLRKEVRILSPPSPRWEGVAAGSRNLRYRGKGSLASDGFLTPHTSYPALATTHRSVVTSSASRLVSAESMASTPPAPHATPASETLLMKTHRSTQSTLLASLSRPSTPATPASPAPPGTPSTPHAPPPPPSPLPSPTPDPIPARAPPPVRTKAMPVPPRPPPTKIPARPPRRSIRETVMGVASGTLRRPITGAYETARGLSRATAGYALRAGEWAGKSLTNIGKLLVLPNVNRPQTSDTRPPRPQAPLAQPATDILGSTFTTLGDDDDDEDPHVGDPFDYPSSVAPLKHPTPPPPTPPPVLHPIPDREGRLPDYREHSTPTNSPTSTPSYYYEPIRLGGKGEAPQAEQANEPGIMGWVTSLLQPPVAERRPSPTRLSHQARASNEAYNLFQRGRETGIADALVGSTPPEHSWKRFYPDTDPMRNLEPNTPLMTRRGSITPEPLW